MYIILELSPNVMFSDAKNRNLASQASGAVSIDKFRDVEMSEAIFPSHKFPALSCDLYTGLHLQLKMLIIVFRSN
jgi:hypothetical protein